MSSWRAAALLLTLFGASACGATVDPLGRELSQDAPEPGPDSDTLRPLDGPSRYPNAFREVLGKSEAEIDAKLESTFQRLFHGDATSEAIYFTAGSDRAFIQDILHGDVRSEGMGLGMLICVELDHRDELDRLWSYAASALRYGEGPEQGYFRSTCSDGPCADPFGQQQLTMALLFAHGRWGSHSGSIDYGAEALRSLAAMRSAERRGATSMFDPESLLVVDEPSPERADRTRPSNVMPGYYALWAEATGDDTWLEIAEASRQLLEAAAHPKTGLLPLRARFDGSAEPGSDAFVPEGYRTQLAMTLDHVFTGGAAWYEGESNSLLDFFSGQGLTSYGASYPLDGSRCIDCNRSLALVAMNGVSALPATQASRSAFIQAVWDAAPTSGDARYYDGLLHLLALLTLAGRLQVY
ncbi:MAG TPA: glycosyl hydrolase family 8 [Polyangiaceae bacterium]|nr:glycosyl hydrolase family 8 [Polyangiaceae bacterium]